MLWYPVANRVASNVAIPPPLRRARNVVWSSTVTRPIAAPPPAAAPLIPPRSSSLTSRRCWTNVSWAAPITSAISSPVTNRAMSMMWAPRSPWLPLPARSLSNRHTSGTSGPAQSCR